MFCNKRKRPLNIFLPIKDAVGISYKNGIFELFPLAHCQNFKITITLLFLLQSTSNLLIMMKKT